MKQLTRLSIAVLILCGVFISMQNNQAAPKPDEAKRVLRHVVLFKFKEGATEKQIHEIEEAFAALPSQIDTIRDFEWGTNNSPEDHAKGFTHCFVVTFDNEEGRAAYLPSAAHQAFVAKLRPILDDVLVIDYWNSKDE